MAKRLADCETLMALLQEAAEMTHDTVEVSPRTMAIIVTSAVAWQGEE